MITGPLWAEWQIVRLRERLGIPAGVVGGFQRGWLRIPPGRKP